jgi:hypothetical protein
LNGTFQIDGGLWAGRDRRSLLAAALIFLATIGDEQRLGKDLEDYQLILQKRI